jgi:glucuronate isomerase
MSSDLRNRIFDELHALVLIDPHTHIDALNPASATLADILGYHYYTELAHSAGLPKDRIEDPEIDEREKCRRLIADLGPIDNTIQYSWFMEMAQVFFGFEGDRITADNWEAVYDTALETMAGDDWASSVLQQSKLEAVFLTNNFDDPLEGFDTSVYVPCLRTDDLVFHLGRSDVRQRLEEAVGSLVSDAASLQSAIGGLFQHFKDKGARACAISLPPDFEPTRVSPGRAGTAVEAVLAKGTDASEADQRAMSYYVFWSLAEFCAEFQLPFDLMIGVNRGVYPDGVFQGRDLYDSRLSLIQYKQLFNAFPQVTFPVSVLASVTNQELTSYAWIFPNVVTNGHWWYSNTPTFIEHDAAARLEAVPHTKQIGYYSDMYKLEFALPKFNMYKRILAKILAERFVIDRGWTEQQAIDLGQQVLRRNVDTTFYA